MVSNSHSIDLDAECHAWPGYKKVDTMTKEVGRLSATDQDADSHASSDSKGPKNNQGSELPECYQSRHGLSRHQVLV